jgi:hypothetical protein
MPLLPAGDIRNFRLTAIGLTAAAGSALLVFYAAQQIAHLSCGPRGDSGPPYSVQPIEPMFGFAFLACAWLQWKFLDAGAILTGSRLCLSAASILYLIAFLPAIPTLMTSCSADYWHDAGEAQGWLIIMFFIFLVSVITPLSLIAHAIAEKRRE